VDSLPAAPRFAVDVERLQHTIEELATIGRGEIGITRLPLSPQDLQAREYVTHLMREAGLLVRADALGNLFGKRVQAADPDLPSVVTGSHICTGTNYGKYDGVVGVLGALEAMRLLNDHNVTTVHPIEVVVFTAEEPERFKAFMPGSRGVAGKLTAEDLRSFRDDDGISLWMIPANWPLRAEPGRRSKPMWSCTLNRAACCRMSASTSASSLPLPLQRASG